jgi:hypothetical protein
MDEARKRAYRLLLYQAMLVIRPLAWRNPEDAAAVNVAHTPPGDIETLFRVGRYCGAVAEWMHNLAHFSATDFAGFNEEWFWEDYERLRQAFPDFSPDWFRGRFEGYLMEPAGEGSA